MVNDSDQLRINAFLKRFGFSSVETATYLEVLKLGVTSMQDLARSLNRNRISVYYSVQQLIEKELLFEMRKGKRRFIAANSTDVFQNLIQSRHVELHSLEKEVAYVTQLIDSIPAIKHEVTVVKQYENIAGFRKMMEESLLAKREILVLSNTPNFLTSLGQDFYEKYFARKAELGISMRMIYPPCEFAEMLNARKDQYKIDLRVLSQNQKSESGFYLWDDTIAIKSLKENKRSCTMIENKDVSHFFRENVFKPFWDVSKPITQTQLPVNL